MLVPLEVLYLILVLFVSTISSREHLDDHHGKSDSHKRLLLNDPQAINEQLLTMQRQIGELTVKVTMVEKENSQLRSEVAALKQDNSHTEGGTIYTRWGRKDCPVINSTSMVYSGIVGGAGYQETGGGTTTLCLPHDPDLSHSDFPNSLQGTSTSTVWGAEYQYNYRNVKIDDDVPCAVCLDCGATTSIMIPGKSICPSGWRQQYQGHLCSSHVGHVSQHEYSCVDDDPQFFEGRREDHNGYLFYPTLTVCGSLPCPPYENSKYLKCVVCTK